MESLPQLPNVKYMTLEDPLFGELKLMVPIPGETPWGTFEPLRGTDWEQYIFEVSGEVYSRACHRDTKLLRQKIGRPPEVNIKKLPLQSKRCRELGTCPMADARKCKLPNTKDLPLCFSLPEEDRDLSFLATGLALAMQEGFYAVVVIGEEFIL